jgi:hypothetical protein
VGYSLPDLLGERTILSNMKTLTIIKTGETVQVENGIAHGMIERGEAFLTSTRTISTKELEKPPRDKMMSKTRSKLRTK